MELAIKRWNTGCHDIAEILLNLTLNTNRPIIEHGG